MRKMDPALLRDVPEVIETERLLLRCPLPGDGAVVNAAVRESWPELQTWMSWAKGDLPTVAHTEMLQLENREGFRERRDFSYNVFLKATGEFVAKSSLFRLDWEVPRGEIGYWMRTRFTGRGLMTEAVAALTDFALNTLGFARVEIRCDPRNLRSAAIPRRLGYTLEGCLRNECRDPQGGLRDTLVFARIAGREEAPISGR